MKTRFLQLNRSPIPAGLRRVSRFVAGMLAVWSLLSNGQAPADTLYVASVNGNKVYRVSTNGTVAAFATINLLPEGLAFDANGRLYVANDGGNCINRVSTLGTVSVFVTNVVQPYGLAFDSKGNLYAASQSSPSGHIRKITPQGVVSSFGPALSAPYGLAVDAADNLYVSTGYGSIYKITPTGASGNFGFVNGATGLALDKAGDLFVADTSGNITRITPAGLSTTFATGLGSSLIGLAFDNAGNLYAASYISGLISKIAPDGAVTAFATVPGQPSFLAVFPPPRFDPGPVSISRADDQVVVSWVGNFVLQSATDAAGPYSDVAGATSPWTNAISTGDGAFFRLRN